MENIFFEILCTSSGESKTNSGCEKCLNPLQRIENHCTSGRVRAIGRCYG